MSLVKEAEGALQKSIIKNYSSLRKNPKRLKTNVLGAMALSRRARKQMAKHHGGSARKAAKAVLKAPHTAKATKDIKYKLTEFK